jgi:hypothetical protein
MDAALRLKGSHAVTNFRSSPPPRTPLLVRRRLPVHHRGRSSVVAQGDTRRWLLTHARPLHLSVLRRRHAHSHDRTTSSRSASSHPRRPWCGTLTRWWLLRSWRPAFDLLYSGSTSWPTLLQRRASSTAAQTASCVRAALGCGGARGRRHGSSARVPCVGAPPPAPTPQTLCLDRRRARRRRGDRQGHPQAPPPDDYTIALWVRAVERRVWITGGGVDRGRAGHSRGGVGLVDVGPSRCGDGGVEVLAGGEQ